MAFPPSPNAAAYVAARCNIYLDMTRDVYITPRGEIGMKEMSELLDKLGAKGLEDYLMCGLAAGRGAQFHQSQTGAHIGPSAAMQQAQMQAEYQKLMAAHTAQMQAALNGTFQQVPGGITPMKGASSYGLGLPLHQTVPAAPHKLWTKKAEAIIAGEIMAWRIWKIAIGSAQCLLRSVATDFVWLPKQPVEGDVLAGFGIHAYKDAYGPVHDGYAGGQYVVGQVALWGDVVEHEKGYRAQYASVRSLDHWSNVSDGVRAKIEKAYLEAAQPPR